MKKYKNDTFLEILKTNNDSEKRLRKINKCKEKVE